MEAVTELTFQQQAVLWGQAYEVLVKRGVLGCLIEQYSGPRIQDSSLSCTLS